MPDPGRGTALPPVRESRVARKRDSGDVAGMVRDEPGDSVRHVGRFDHRDWQGIGQRYRQRWVAVEDLLYGVIDAHGRIDRCWVDRIDTNLVRSQVICVG